MSVMLATDGGIAGDSGPLHCTPSPPPMTEPGAPMFASRSALPFSRWVTLTVTFDSVLPRFVADTVQCEAPVFDAKLSGEQVCESVTLPCVFTNATGIVTAFPPALGTRVIRPWYWPFAT